MFTGIVTHRGSLAAVERSGADRRMTFEVEGDALVGAAEGDSMCVSGACLTMLDLETDGERGGRFSADVSAETLEKTTLGDLDPGDPVNLEPALRAGDRMGGHLVTGHVDGRGHLVDRSASDGADGFRFEVPAALARYIAAKGSVCIDGVSLTVNTVEGRCFEVCIIPHTQAVTTLGRLRPGQAVNIEVDLIARYVERLASAKDESA